MNKEASQKKATHGGAGRGQGRKPSGKPHKIPVGINVEILIVKKYAAQVGLDPSQFAGHSLRSGFLTSAARKRASLFKMQEVSRHKSLDVLQGYVRDAEKFDDHAGEGLLVDKDTSAHR